MFQRRDGSHGRLFGSEYKFEDAIEDAIEGGIENGIGYEASDRIGE